MIDLQGNLLSARRIALAALVISFSLPTLLMPQFPGAASMERGYQVAWLSLKSVRYLDELSHPGSAQNLGDIFALCLGWMANLPGPLAPLLRRRPKLLISLLILAVLVATIPPFLKDANLLFGYWVWFLSILGLAIVEIIGIRSRSNTSVA